ncbi:MAG: hypothetical protein ACETWK_05805 [Candidatus Aminicenantaceae bacterium]
MKSLEMVVEIKGKKFLFKVETSNNPIDYIKYEQLREEIWNFPQDHLPGSRNMMCENFLVNGSSLFIGAFSEKEKGGFSKQDKAHLVGFAYGFLGVKDKEIGFRSTDNLQFYSQYVGVRKDFQNFGLGILIKEFQRDKLMDLFGVYTMTCTYDALTGINAYRNIHHFGMEVIEYKVDHYSDFGGSLNRIDVPSDRFFMSWDLRKKEPQRPAYNLESLLENEQIVTEVDYTEIQGKNSFLELEVIRGINLNLAHEFLLVEAPRNFYQMLQETDVQDESVRVIPFEWRMKTRQAFQNLLQRGYRIIDFRLIEISKRRRNFYVLKR